MAKIGDIYTDATYEYVVHRNKGEKFVVTRTAINAADGDLAAQDLTQAELDAMAVGKQKK